MVYYLLLLFMAKEVSIFLCASCDQCFDLLSCDKSKPIDSSSIRSVGVLSCTTPLLYLPLLNSRECMEFTEFLISMMSNKQLHPSLYVLTTRLFGANHHVMSKRRGIFRERKCGIRLMNDWILFEFEEIQQNENCC